MNKLDGRLPHRCTVCGKIFQAGKDWGYRYGDGDSTADWLCSYSCMRKREQEGGIWRMNKGRKATFTDEEAINAATLRKSGVSLLEIGKSCQASYTKVKAMVERGLELMGEGTAAGAEAAEKPEKNPEETAAETAAETGTQEERQPAAETEPWDEQKQKIWFGWANGERARAAKLGYALAVLEAMAGERPGAAARAAAFLREEPAALGTGMEVEG